MVQGPQACPRVSIIVRNFYHLLRDRAKALHVLLTGFMLIYREMNPLANLPYIVDGDKCVCQTNAVRTKPSQKTVEAHTH